MTRKRATIPMKVRAAKSHKPCESCGFRPVRYKADLKIPGSKGKRWYLCEECIEAFRLGDKNQQSNPGRKVA